MATNFSKINVMLWNANSIVPKKHEFFDFLIENDIQIALLSETYLKPGIGLYHSDFSCYRLDRVGRSKGGVAIVVHRSIAHHLNQSPDTKVLECIGVSVPSPSGTLQFISAYLPGGSQSSGALQKFRSDLVLLTRQSSSFFICGDLNSRHRAWNCSRANQAGKILFAEMNTGNFTVYHPPTPTRIPLNSRQQPSTIDLILSNGLHAVSGVSTKTALSSDHLPVLFEVEVSVQREVPDFFIFDYAHANWDLFRRILDENLGLDISLDRMESGLDLDVMVDTFTSVLVDARSHSVPMVRPTRFSLTLTPHIKSIIRLKNSQRHRAQRARLTGNERAKKRAAALYNMLNRLVQCLVSGLSNNSFQRKISTLRPGHKSLWNFTKLIKNRARCVPTLKIGGNTLITDAEKADAIAGKFAESHNNAMISPLANLVQASCSALQDGGLNNDASTYTSPREIRAIIKRLRNGKAPGGDAVNNSLLKNLSRKALVFLTYLFNGCLKLSYFPIKWKHASVIPIPKPNKDHSNPSNFRPISLLSAVSKLFERVILKRFNEFLNDNNLLPNHQFGFRAAHSAAHQLNRVVGHIKTNRSSQKSTGMVFLDVEKAFDSVWHAGLLHKLLISNCRLYLAKIIASFLSGRSFHVCVNKSISSSHPIPYGVPQGAILSPSLYNFFTADSPLGDECETATFADDTAIYMSDGNPNVVCTALQRHLDTLSSYFKQWKIKINPSKTQAIYFTRCWAPRKLPSTNIKIDGHPITWASEVKYLGVTLDKTLTFASHTAKSVEKSEKAFRILYSFLNRKSKLNVHNKLLLYKTCIRSILCYGVETWYHCAYTHKKRLQIIQNKCLKIIMNRHWRFSTSTLHEETNIPLLEEFSERVYSKFIAKCRFSGNPLIANIAT
jgi:hypothetical protein